MTGRLRRVGVVAAAVCLVALAAFTSAGAAGQTSTTPTYDPPRTPDGQPDLQGAWRVWTLAKYDVEPHSASQGVPAGSGVIVDPADGLIPYKPWALAHKRENVANSRITYPYDPLENADPLARWCET